MSGIFNAIFDRILASPKKEEMQESLYYKQLHSAYEDIDPYVHLLDDWKTMKAHACSDPLYFSPKVRMACSKKKLKSVLGNPQCNYESDKWLDREILFFKTIFHAYSSDLEFHFHNNRLFYFKYSFSFLSNLDKEEVLNNIVAKENGAVLKQSDTYLINDSGIVLLMNDTNPNLTIHCFDSTGRAMQELLNMGFFYRKNPNVVSPSQTVADSASRNLRVQD